ncbi:O-methyltransferase [Lachnotalea sp. AF33-28]|uniref:O-methyltransferase n=1 Tax=Lachnotalea sp. AF33-28 TaxID=2292046 RepID=UPI000E4D04EE|nr:O-methyltransferase [Lachnotalea sp. AF33-28]RHP33264.1 O-methyltransferase [Lachnotalea sp. AF33-28]
MMADERTAAYIRSLEQEKDPFLRELEKEAKRDLVPIIRKETASLLRTLVALKRPENILEVGTAIGYSALLMSGAMPDGCTITTIEKYEKRIPMALNNFRKAGMENRIRLLEGDASDILKTLKGPYDFIFMDAAKGQYIHFLEDVLRLMPNGGVLVSDNVLQDGDVIESRYAVTRRDRTIHSRMREYLYTLKHTEGLETSVIPIGDGVTVSVKLKDLPGGADAGAGRAEPRVKMQERDKT